MLEPYEPCPCASGKKYKFCCRGKELLSTTAAAKEKQSADMLEYIQPLLAQAGDDEASVQSAVNYGLICWKLAQKSDMESIEMDIAILAESMTREKPSKYAECVETIRKMVFRHRQMFPEKHSKTQRGQLRIIIDE